MKVIAVLLLAILLLQFFPFLPVIEKWEYKVIAPYDEELDSVLTDQGREGWEIVTARRVDRTAVVPAAVSPKDARRLSIRGVTVYELILKRRK